MIDAVGNPQSVLVLGGTSEIALAVVRRYTAARKPRVVLAARPSHRRDEAVAALAAAGVPLWYSAGYLRFVWATAAAIMILAYALWAFEMRQRADYDSGWAMLSIVPFVVAVLRYAVDVDDGGAGEPERIVLRDHALQAIGVCWVASLALSIYV